MSAFSQRSARRHFGRIESWLYRLTSLCFFLLEDSAHAQLGRAKCGLAKHWVRAHLFTIGVLNYPA